MVEHKIQGEFGNAKHWSKRNNLPINYKKKSHCMMLGTRRRLIEARKLSIQVDDICLQTVSTQKVLGRHIDEHLTLTTHIDHLCSAISSKISLMRQIAEYVPIDVQKRFYLPLIYYGSITWGAASNLKENIDRVSKFQNRAARIILRADFDTPSSAMFRELNWFPIENRLKYNKAVSTYRALNKLTPDYISNILKPLSESHSLKTLLHVQPRSYGMLYLKLSEMLILF